MSVLGQKTPQNHIEDITYVVLGEFGNYLQKILPHKWSGEVDDVNRGPYVEMCN